MEVQTSKASLSLVPERRSDAPMLDIRDLRVRFPLRNGKSVQAVNGVNLSIPAGESLGVVGESGCGKSVTFSSVIRLIKTPPAIIEGEIFFEGRDIMKMEKHQLQKLRGKDITMIFQEPMTSLNPVMRIGSQVTETLLLHEKISKKEAEERALEYFKLVEIPDAERRFWCYPHQLSGGLRQRVMISMALACNPKLLLADEPTTALDVTIQAQILDLLERLQQKTGMSVVMITHDLGIIAEIAKRIVVFYAGRIVEEAETQVIFDKPLHPYTMGLLGCIPTLRTDARRLYMIEGSIPDSANLPCGCPFHPRCRFAKDVCREAEPPKRMHEAGHWVACHRAGEL